MDEDSKELVQAVTEAGVGAFFKTVAGPLVEASAWAGDVVRRYRFKGQVRTLIAAQQMLSDAGLEAFQVSLKVLVPLLEYAGLEDDVDTANDPAQVEAMTERWAALLANAAAADSAAEVQPAFPRILSELAPVEAAALDWLAMQPTGTDLPAFLQRFGYSYADLEGGKWHLHNAYVENLERLRLCQINRGYPEGVRTAVAAFAWTDRPMPVPVHLTDLGHAFVAACRPPTGAHGGAQES